MQKKVKGIFVETYPFAALCRSTCW